MAQFPDIAPDSYSENKEDNTIRDNFEYGYVQTRKKYTRARRLFQYSFKNISNADADTIMAFYDTVETFDSFDLALPQNRGTVTVRFTKPPKRQFVTPNTSSVTDVEFREV